MTNIEIPVFDELSFDEAKHWYRLNGNFIPSVSAVMRPLSQALYKDVDEEVLNKAKRHEERLSIMPLRTIRSLASQTSSLSSRDISELSGAGGKKQTRPALQRSAECITKHSDMQELRICQLL